MFKICLFLTYSYSCPFKVGYCILYVQYADKIGKHVKGNKSLQRKL